MMLRFVCTHLATTRSQLGGPALGFRVTIVHIGMVILLSFGATRAFPQGRFTDVLVSVINNKVVAVTGVGQSEIDLSVGETVVSIKAQGLTALAITSTRLLGFSSQLRHWGEQTLETDEHVNTSHVLRELCVVATDQHLYGFQETLAHWTSEALGGSERVQELRGQGHLALAVTTDRLVGYSAFMSGFHTMALQADERVQGIEHTGDAYLVKTTRRTLMLRSRIAGWTDVN
jgi:hypothetical protein